MPKRVAVVGAGYVGLTTAGCLAYLGHDVVCVDVDEGKVAELSQARVAIKEPGLGEVVADGLAAGRLRFTTCLSEVDTTEVVFLCVPTPMSADGAADLGPFDAAVAALSVRLRPTTVLVTKSTVPVGTAARTTASIGRADIAVVSNPEFLREGHAVHDFLHPDRILIGADDRVAGAAVARLYAKLTAPVVHSDPASAELAKYASNAFLAVKLSYINLLAQLCEQKGADIGEVTKTMGLDPRIGPAFLAPGPGWGGSCLPKDTRALLRSARDVQVDFAVLRAAIDANTRQHELVVGKIRSAVDSPLRGVRIGLLGLTFKAGTDDLRDSPALAIARLLAADGALLTGYDPEVPASARVDAGPVHVVDDPQLVAKDARAIVVLTEWPEFRKLDWAELAEVADRAAVVDTRNLLDPQTLRARGFSYYGMGRLAVSG